MINFTGLLMTTEEDALNHDSTILQICALFSAVILAYFAFRQASNGAFENAMNTLYNENVELKNEISQLKLELSILQNKMIAREEEEKRKKEDDRIEKEKLAKRLKHKKIDI